MLVTMTKILIIEDNEFARENINEILELEGFETLLASHGEQGFKLAQQHIPDLIICDVMMPKLNGYEVLEKLAEQDMLASIPFIFLTAKSSHQDFRQGMTSGSDDYLTKPFSPSELVAAVRSQLLKREALAHKYIQKINGLKSQMAKLSELDAITKLPNQKALNQSLKQPFSQAGELYLLIISVDQLYSLNGTLNTYESDCLVKLIAQRIQKLFPDPHREDGKKDVFRLTESQFAVLTNQLSTKHKSPSDIIRSFHNLLGAPYVVADQMIKITVSIGIATTAQIPKETATVSKASTLLRDATSAVHKIQREGGNGYCFYTEKITLDASERLSIANALHYALKLDEFQVNYQPQVNLLTGEVVGVEALIRWNNAQLGQVSPEKFIPIAEEIGLIDELGKWMLWSACKQARAWQKGMAKPISISVNLSSLQLEHDDLYDTIKLILAKTELPAHLLHLEITETALIKHKSNAIQTLQRIRKMGVHIVIDDFGTGYAGLGYLSSLPCHTIKIDRSFIQNIAQHSTNQRIVAAVISMSRDLNLNVIAEGAETEDEMSYLKQHGCDMLQGYVYAKPMPAADVAAFVKATSLQAVGQCLNR